MLSLHLCHQNISESQDHQHMNYGVSCCVWYQEADAWLDRESKESKAGTASLASYCVFWAVPEQFVVGCACYRKLYELLL